MSLVVLHVQDVILQSPRQRQEAHEDGRSEPQATETATDPQAAEMLQTASALCRGQRSQHHRACFQSLWRFLAFTLQPADIGPLLLLHHRRLQQQQQQDVCRAADTMSDSISAISKPSTGVTGIIHCVFYNKRLVCVYIYVCVHAWSEASAVCVCVCVWDHSQYISSWVWLERSLRTAK